jgi:hypothetical protein
MTLTIYVPAGRHQAFAESAFDSTIGTLVPLRVDDGPAVSALVADAVVAVDGRGVMLTLEVDG